MIFTKRKVPPSYSIKVEGIDILIEKEAKILGVIFDKKLTWRKQFDVIAAKCKQAINLMRRLSGLQWGAHPQQMLKIYYALIRSKMDYGSEILESATATTKKKLDSIQAYALRVCLGLPKSTATEALLVEAGEMPLNLRRELAASKYLLRCKNQADFPINKEVTETWFENSPSAFIRRAASTLATAKVEPKLSARDEEFPRGNLQGRRCSFLMKKRKNRAAERITWRFTRTEPRRKTVDAEQRSQFHLDPSLTV